MVRVGRCLRVDLGVLIDHWGFSSFEFAVTAAPFPSGALVVVVVGGSAVVVVESLTVVVVVVDEVDEVASVVVVELSPPFLVVLVVGPLEVVVPSFFVVVVGDVVVVDSSPGMGSPLGPPDRALNAERSGSVKRSTGRPSVATAMKSCQISVGQEPPATRKGVRGGTMGI